VKHASAETIARLDELLGHLRMFPGLVERTPGTFYLGSKAFLHFHEDESHIFADVKLDGREFERLPASSRTDQQHLLNRIAAVVGAVPVAKGKRS
jgi:hypothetical protein